MDQHKHSPKDENQLLRSALNHRADRITRAQNIAVDSVTANGTIWMIHAERSIPGGNQIMKQIGTQKFQPRAQRIGGTVYKVKVAFSDTAEETLEEKILRLVRNEGLESSFRCGMMKAPQTSRQSEGSTNYGSNAD